MNRIYIIDGENETFRTLHAAKHHVYIAYTKDERIKYLLNTSIVCIANDEAISETPIIIDEQGNYAFGKTVKTK